MVKPSRLMIGDTVATVSLSSGMAGDRDFLFRYNTGKERLKEEFGLNVVEMKNTLAGSDYVYNNPEKRAKDLMEAFLNPDIKGIFACIGGDDSIRMLPYIDFSIIRDNPKIFLGYSDSTITHLMCYKAGVTSFYGPSILAEFAENIKMFDYTESFVDRALFSSKPIEVIDSSKIWASEYIPWEERYQNVPKKVFDNKGYEVLQGTKIATGKLFGGCMEVLEFAKGTSLWPDFKEDEDIILFFETSEEKPQPKYIKCWLRNYASMGLLQQANGVIFGKPCEEKYYEEYKNTILQVFKEYNISDTPIFYNANFGHNQPMCIIPYGITAELNCGEKKFSIIESATEN